MAFDLDEQEQLATLQNWWKKYGTLITVILIIVLLIYTAWSGWGYYQRNQATQASQLYEEQQKAVASKDTTKVLRAAVDIQQKFSRTAYATMAALSAAKMAFDGNDLNGAKEQLQWVLGHGYDQDYKALARIRLAGILLDQKAYEEGLKLISVDLPSAYTSVAADRKGDILLAQNKREQARIAYQLALEKSTDSGKQLIQLKLDAIGIDHSKKEE